MVAKPLSQCALERHYLIEQGLMRACHIARLVQWIERSRHLAGEVEAMAKAWPELRARCEASEIRPAAADWAGEHSEALDALLSLQWELVADAKSAASSQHGRSEA